MEMNYSLHISRMHLANSDIKWSQKGAEKMAQRDQKHHLHAEAWHLIPVI